MLVRHGLLLYLILSFSPVTLGNQDDGLAEWSEWSDDCDHATRLQRGTEITSCVIDIGEVLTYLSLTIEILIYAVYACDKDRIGGTCAIYFPGIGGALSNVGALLAAIAHDCPGAPNFKAKCAVDIISIITGSQMLISDVAGIVKLCPLAKKTTTTTTIAATAATYMGIPAFSRRLSEGRRLSQEEYYDFVGLYGVRYAVSRALLQIAPSGVDVGVVTPIVVTDSNLIKSTLAETIPATADALEKVCGQAVWLPVVQAWGISGDLSTPAELIKEKARWVDAINTLDMFNGQSPYCDLFHYGMMVATTSFVDDGFAASTTVAANGAAFIATATQVSGLIITNWATLFPLPHVDLKPVHVAFDINYGQKQLDEIEPQPWVTVHRVQNLKAATEKILAAWAKGISHPQSVLDVVHVMDHSTKAATVPGDVSNVASTPAILVLAEQRNVLYEDRIGSYIVHAVNTYGIEKSLATLKDFQHENFEYYYPRHWTPAAGGTAVTQLLTINNSPQTFSGDNNMNAGTGALPVPFLVSVCKIDGITKEQYVAHEKAKSGNTATDAELEAQWDAMGTKAMTAHEISVNICPDCTNNNNPVLASAKYQPNLDNQPYYLNCRRRLSLTEDHEKMQYGDWTDVEKKVFDMHAKIVDEETVRSLMEPETVEEFNNLKANLTRRLDALWPDKEWSFVDGMTPRTLSVASNVVIAECATVSIQLLFSLIRVGILISNSVSSCKFNSNYGANAFTCAGDAVGIASAVSNVGAFAAAIAATCVPNIKAGCAATVLATSGSITGIASASVKMTQHCRPGCQAYGAANPIGGLPFMGDLVKFDSNAKASATKRATTTSEFCTNTAYPYLWENDATKQRCMISSALANAGTTNCAEFCCRSGDCGGTCVGGSGVPTNC